MNAVKDVNATRFRRPRVGLPKAGRVVLAALLAVALAGGCHKNGGRGGAPDEGIAPADPQVAENLANLTRSLRQAMRGQKLSPNFEEFAAASHLDVPAPPPGEKYAISKKWKVILVEAK